MSLLARNATFTGGDGDETGSLNQATIGTLEIAPVAPAPRAQ